MPEPSTVVVLAGGTGGAKLAQGLHDLVGDDLVVVANTGDDVEAYGAHVSPDPDLVSFRLAGVLDERGWGLRDDTFAVMDALAALGRDVWFRLGDRDLAWCLERSRLLAAGATLTEAHGTLTRALGVRARVLPMCDEPVRTRVRAGGVWHGLQEFLIRRGGAGPVEDVAFEGAADARPTAAVLEAIASARAILIGPSNPVISIGPILAVPGMFEALREAPAPVVAVSPVVGGAVLKGPTAAFLAWAGTTCDTAGIADTYHPLAAALLADEPAASAALPVRVAPTRMDDAGARRQVAGAALALAADAR